MISYKKRKNIYPGADETERMNSFAVQSSDDEPDSFGIAPNYDKFNRKGWSVEEVLSWFNID